MDDQPRIPGWVFLILFLLAIFVLGSLGNQNNIEPDVGICNRPTVQQAC